MSFGYFKNSTDYPSNELLCLALPENELFSYVSSTYLNGFINYCKPIKAFCMERYLGWEEALDGNHTVQVQDPPGSFKWVDKKPATKHDLFTLLTEPGRTFHAHLDVDFQDDVAILARVGETNSYIFFYFDRDCSDCELGRFVTDDAQDSVVAEFVKYILTRGFPDEPNRHREIPLHYFRGWLGS